MKMKSYCLNCRKNTENINSKVSKTSNGKTMVLSKCAICDSKKSRFIKNPKAKGLLSNLGVRTPFSKLPILGYFVLICMLNRIKMSEMVNKFLSAGDKFMPEMHFKQPRFTYSDCGPFPKNKEIIQNLKKQEIQAIFTKTNLIRLVFNMIWLMEVLKNSF